MVLRCLEFILKVATTCVMFYISFICILVYLAFANTIRFPDDLMCYQVQLISIVVAITSAFFGIVPYFFDSYIDFTRIFLRLHNVSVLWILYLQLVTAHKTVSLAAYEEDIFEEHYETAELFSTEDVGNLKNAVKRTEMNMLMLPVLNGILTLIFVWKVIKFILFYYLEIDI